VRLQLLTWVIQGLNVTDRLLSSRYQAAAGNDANTGVMISP